MICNFLNYLVALHVLAAALRRPTLTQGAQDFQRKVSLMLQQEPENPKCFAEGRKDFTCFWLEDEERAGSVDQYSFTYTYKNENSSRCPLRVVPAPNGKVLFVCHLNKTRMFVEMEIQVRREEMLIHNRTLLIDRVFLLNPPANVSVSPGQDQLNVTWLPPALKYMDDSMMYEVSYTAADSHFWQVEVVGATSELILRGLQPGTMYKVRVRVKLDGLSYSGYWSSWSQPVSIETLPAELDLLIVSLALSTFFVLLGMFLKVALSVRRYLVQKIWPTIPIPDNKFKGLFTVHGGDFQEWLEQTSGGLWLMPAVFSAHEHPSPLEVLSELNLYSSLPPPPLSLERVHTTTTTDNNDNLATRGSHGRELLENRPSARHSHLPMDCLRMLHQDKRRNPAPCSQSSLLESQDAYVTLSAAPYSQEGRLEGVTAKDLPLEALFTSKNPASCDTHSDTGSVPQSSGSGRLSSSVEYPNHVWMAKGPGYTYMAAADSGVSMDYSPMSRIDDTVKSIIYANNATYKNEITTHENGFC